MLSLQQIATCTGAASQRAEPFVVYLNAAMVAYAINTAQRQAAFLAQLGHESAGLSRLVENLNYTADALIAKFSRDRISKLDALTYGRTAAHPADQVEIANRIYGGEWGRANLGNTQPGDGWRYRAHGPTGTTGRANCAKVRDRLRVRFGTRVPNFEDQPEKLTEPEWGAYSAADFWDMRGLNALADAGNFELITRRINGGLNGYADRLQRWEIAKEALGIV